MGISSHGVMKERRCEVRNAARIVGTIVRTIIIEVARETISLIDTFSSGQVELKFNLPFRFVRATFLLPPVDKPLLYRLYAAI